MPLFLCSRLRSKEKQKDALRGLCVSVVRKPYSNVMALKE
jgi:hypothetical protein